MNNAPIPEPVEERPIPSASTASPSGGGDATGGLIPYKNSSALIAYYLGVFSIIPCFPLGLAAFFLGLKGLKYYKEHPETKGKAHAWVGIIAGGFFGFGWLLVMFAMIISAILANR